MMTAAISKEFFPAFSTESLEGKASNGNIFHRIKHALSFDMHQLFVQDLHSIYKLQGLGLSAETVKEVYAPVRELARIISEKFNTPQAYVMAMAMPRFISCFGKENSSEFAKIGWSIGVGGYSDDQIVKNYRQKIVNNNKALGISETLAEAGVSEDAFAEIKGYVFLRMVEVTSFKPTRLYRKQLMRFLDSLYLGD